ncbi:MAG: extracellular solute-binding protein [Oscillospiraceae bacterium]|nr:extracellular solute-binding protein [Oscillospiraceae bacterium]
MNKIIIVLFLLIFIVACGSNKTNIETGDNIREETESDNFVKDNIPRDLNFGGKKVSILYWEDVSRPEFFVGEIVGEIVNDAIYNRNLIVENRLGVELTFTGTPGNNANQANFVNYASQSVMSGSGEFDIFAAYSMVGATLAVNKLTQSLLDYEIIDFKMPWWPDSLINVAQIKDKLYFASGDISTNLINMMYCIFFNKNMLEDFKLESPYDYVLNGKWTIDKLIEMSAGVYGDLNGDNVKGEEDRFGYISQSVSFDNFYIASGLKLIERDEEGFPVFSADFRSEKVKTILDKICAWFYNTNDALAVHIQYPNYLQVFPTGRALFFMNYASTAETSLKNVDFLYGVLPVPKYDEVQEEYITMNAFPYTLYSISRDSRNAEAAAAVLECLASENYRSVTPALFEIAMKVKYSDENIDAQMFDIIKSGISFDLGRIFTASFNNLTWSMFRQSIVDNNTNWASTYASNEKTLQASLENILDAILSD